MRPIIKQIEPGNITTACPFSSNIFPTRGRVIKIIATNPIK